MPAIIQLPHVGESVTEGVIGKWLVKPGDRVEKYDPLVEVSTDKVNMEVPAPFSGVILRILVEEGDTIEMGKPIAELEIDGAQDNPVEDEATENEEEIHFDREAERRARVGEFLEEVRSVGPTGSGEGGLGRPDVDSVLADDPSDSSFQGEADSINSERLSPLVKRMIEQYQLSPEEIQGSGRDGRLTKSDVLAHLEFKEGRSNSKTVTSSGGFAEIEGENGGQSDRIELTPIRRTIAEHMSKAARDIPSAWTMIEVDLSELVSWRNQHKHDFKAQHSVNLSYPSIIGWFTAKVLSENPTLNSSWAVDSIKQFSSVNLGIAVSTESGLIVPVIHRADEMNFTQFATKLDSLVSAARNGTLELNDVHGGTFTFNNTGALGSIISVPIVNHPQAAILTTEAIVKRPVVTESDAIAIRSIINLCLSFDHRVCDGHDAGIFLSSLKKMLEHHDFSSILN